MNISIKLKRIFLSFLQQYFQQMPGPYTWDPDPKKTKIFIGDKFSPRVGTAEKYPAILLAMGSKRWAFASIDQRNDIPSFPAGLQDTERMDLVLGSVTYQCLSPNPVEAQELADLIFSLMVGYKNIFKYPAGLSRIMQIAQGEEQQLRADNIGRLYAVPVNISYSIQDNLSTADAAWDLIVYSPNYNMFIQESPGFISSADSVSYTVSGIQLLFNNPPPSGLLLSAKYTNAITLENTTEQIQGVVDGFNTVFSLTAPPYAYYSQLNHIVISGIGNV